MTCLASVGLIAATIYSLRFVQKVFLGTDHYEGKIWDLSVREKLISAVLVIIIVWLGLMPQPVLNMAKPAILNTLSAKEKNAEKPGAYLFHPANNIKDIQ